MLIAKPVIKPDISDPSQTRVVDNSYILIWNEWKSLIGFPSGVACESPATPCPCVSPGQTKDHCTLWNLLLSPCRMLNSCVSPLYVNKNAQTFQHTPGASGSLTLDHSSHVWSHDLKYSNMHNSEGAADGALSRFYKSFRFKTFRNAAHYTMCNTHTWTPNSHCTRISGFCIVNPIGRQWKQMPHWFVPLQSALDINGYQSSINWEDMRTKSIMLVLFDNIMDFEAFYKAAPRHT